MGIIALFSGSNNSVQLPSIDLFTSLLSTISAFVAMFLTELAVLNQSAQHVHPNVRLQDLNDYRLLRCIIELQFNSMIDTLKE